MSKGAVIYTDGGFMGGNHVKRMGFGIHGYIYDTVKGKQGNGLNTHLLTATGYLPKNEATAGDGASEVTAISYLDWYGSTQEEGNSFLAELLAIREAISHFTVTDTGIEMLNIYTDSDTIVRLINDDKLVSSLNLEITKKNGEKVKFQDEWGVLLTGMATLKDKGVVINIRWVKSHSDYLGNQFADVLATLGLRYSLLGRDTITKDIVDAKGYWKMEVDKNPLINLKRMYFKTNGGTTKLFMSNPKEDELIGRRLAESCYAVVKLSEPEEVLDTVKLAYTNVVDGYDSIAMVNLVKLYSKRVYPYVKKHGTVAMVQKFKQGKFVFNFLDDDLLTEELFPAALSIRAMDNFEFLNNLLENLDNDVPDKYVAIDITEYFFKDGVVNPDLRLADRVQVPVKFNLLEEVEFLASLNLGIDVLDRNSLKKIEKSNVKIQLVVWYSGEKVINYATHLTSDIGTGIWSNYFSNKVFLK